MAHTKQSQSLDRTEDAGELPQQAREPAIPLVSSIQTRQLTNRMRAPIVRLSSIIRPTKLSSPPCVIISDADPVQTLGLRSIPSRSGAARTEKGSEDFWAWR